MTDVPSTDVLPDDLDPTTAQLEPYQFPDVARRKIAGWIYVALVMLCLGGYGLSKNSGLLAAVVVLAAIATYQFACAWPLRIDQTDALATASREVGFPVGHASAQVTWRGLRSRPLWRVVVYSAEEPPESRGIVELDAVDATVLFTTSEKNPEDWPEPKPA